MANNDEVMAVEQRLGELERTVSELKETLSKGFHDQGERTNKLEDRVGALEKTMAKEFFAYGARMNRLEDRVGALDSKLDIVSESIRGDVKTVLEVVAGFTSEMRHTTEAIRKEHEADRRLTRAILNDHTIRIRALEPANHEPVEPR